MSLHPERSLKLANGALMPVVGLGTWKSGVEAGRAVEVAIEAGYRHIDCAYIYMNEKEVGCSLQQAFSKGLRRDEVFLTTKLWNTFHRPELVRVGLQRSCERLQVGFVDLLLMHWPIAYQAGEENAPVDSSGNVLYDLDTHFTDTWKAMEELVDSGLACAIGLSNFNQQQTEEILKIARIKPAVLQVENHPFLTQDDLVEFCRSQSIVVTAYCPLARADFPRPDRPGNLLENTAVLALAKKHSVTPAQILIRFQIQRGLIVIPKSVTPSRIKENFQVFHFQLSDDDVRLLKGLNVNWRVLANERDNHHPWFPF